MSSYTQTGKIRVQMWSLLEQDPKLLQELSEKSNNQTNSTKKELSEDFFYQYSVNEIKNLAPFVFEGIIHGWNFSYTPYDKTRQVDEYFEFAIDGPNISKNDKNILVGYIDDGVKSGIDKYLLSFLSILIESNGYPTFLFSFILSTCSLLYGGLM